MNAGHRVVGLDSSAGMLDHFRANVPGAFIIHGDARRCPFVKRRLRRGDFDGDAVSPSRADQDLAFASVSRVLKPGAPFLFTGAEIEDADDAGITGTMNGVTFHYYAVRSYRMLAAEHGLVLVDVQDDPGVATYYLGRKSP